MISLVLLLLAQPATSLNGEPLTAVKCDGGIVCSRRGTTAYVFGTSSGGAGYSVVQDEGAALTSRSTLDFTGAGVTCSDTGAKTSCSIPGGAGGAPTTATYITQTPDGTLTNEQALSSNATGLMISTTGTGVVSSYAGTSCTNQFPRALNASGAATCASVALGSDVTGSLAGTNGGLGGAQPTCGAGQYLTCNGTTCSCSTPAGGGGGTSPLVVLLGSP